MKKQAMTQFLRELQQQIEKTLERMEAADNANIAAEAIPNQMRTTLKSAKRVIELQQPSRVEKSAQIIGKSQTPYEDYRKAQEMAQHLYELKNSYVMLERSLDLLRLKSEQDREEIPELEARVEIIGEHVENIRALQRRATELKAERRKLHFWEGRRKKEIDKELEQVEANCRVAQHSFNSKYHIPYDEAPSEIKRIQKKIGFKQSELDKRSARAADIAKELTTIEIEYRNQRQIADNHPDRALIDSLLEQMRETPVSTRKSLRQLQLERHLDAIAGGKIR
ncbi:MAG: hypothetical protein LBH74_00690 [Nitrososphaerota archaeon]|jgi:chromosome segregation ATPase|nr:hypothetical protein [Nitrososphaerota archaeon]